MSSSFCKISSLNSRLKHRIALINKKKNPKENGRQLCGNKIQSMRKSPTRNNSGFIRKNFGELKTCDCRKNFGELKT